MKTSNPVTEKAAPVIFSSSCAKPSPSAVTPSSSLAENTAYLHYYGPGVVPTQTASTALFLPERFMYPFSNSSAMPSSIHSNTQPYPPHLDPVQHASSSVTTDASIPPTTSYVSQAGSASLTPSGGLSGSNSGDVNDDASISGKESKSSENSEDIFQSSTDSTFYGLISRPSQTANPTSPHDASDQSTL